MPGKQQQTCRSPLDLTQEKLNKIPNSFKQQWKTELGVDSHYLILITHPLQSKSCFGADFQNSTIAITMSKEGQKGSSMKHTLQPNSDKIYGDDQLVDESLNF